MQKEMTFRELLGIVCARWRMLLVFMVVFALLLGGYRTYSLLQSVGDSETTTELLETNRVEQQLYEDKMALLTGQIERLTEQEEKAAEYNENSLLLRVDPYNMQVARISFSINADIAALAQEMPEAWQVPTSVDLKANREARIANQYMILAARAPLSELAEDTAYSRVGDQFLRELVTVNNDEQGTLTIEVVNAEQVDGMELAEKLFAYCQSKQREVAATAGAHTLKLVDAGNATEIDLNLGNTQVSAQNRPDDIAAKLAAKVTELEALEEPVPTDVVSTSSALKSGIKYAILGAVVGAVAGAVIAFFVATMGVYCRNGAALAEAAASRYLGNLRPYSRKRGLDAWAESLLGADIFSTVATEDRLPLLAANLKETAGDKRKLLVTGMRSQAELEALTAELQKQLGEEYKLIAEANLLVNAKAIQQLKNVEGVVMVGGAKTAHIERVVKTKQYIEEAKGSLVGVVWA